MLGFAEPKCKYPALTGNSRHGGRVHLVSHFGVLAKRFLSRRRKPPAMEQT